SRYSALVASVWNLVCIRRDYYSSDKAAQEYLTSCFGVGSEKRNHGHKTNIPGVCRSEHDDCWFEPESIRRGDGCRDEERRSLPNPRTQWRKSLDGGNRWLSSGKARSDHR